MRPDWVILPFVLLVVVIAACAVPFQAVFFNQVWSPETAGVVDVSPQIRRNIQSYLLTIGVWNPQTSPEKAFRGSKTHTHKVFGG